VPVDSVHPIMKEHRTICYSVLIAVSVVILGSPLMVSVPNQAAVSVRRINFLELKVILVSVSLDSVNWRTAIYQSNPPNYQ
jgi:hypothetical protein